jgi:tetratricopeptide (TPR) repeat protein
MDAKKVCLFLLSFVMFGCSTSRNTYFNRKYHDLTAYYNVYFNGQESLKQAYKKAEALEAQNFDEILPVFSFEYEQVSGLVSAEMQRAIDKGNKMIEKHSITAKPKRKKNMNREQREFYNKKEFNRFVDDAHLVMGKANLYLHEYPVSEEKFALIVTEYPKETSAYDAQAYQAILFSQNRQYVNAEDLLASLSKKQDIPRKTKSLIDEAFADMYIKQNKYQEAIPYLEKALKQAKGKNKKIRFNYILGQLYQKTNNNSKSVEHFSKVLKKNPPYLTAFSAEMSMAYTYSSETQKNNVRKILEKALKTEQNASYHDQIYYAFAKLEETEGNISKALEYFRKSIGATGVGTRQKGLSYLALAEHYIKDNDYINAYTCYDSSAIMLGADHSLYEEVSSKASKYRKLALNMKIVEHEDGLQKLANLSEDDLDRLIDERMLQAEIEKKKMDEEQERLTKLKADIDAQLAQGQWYFYNPVSLELGKTDFAMRWGERKLEDNWRRKNRGIQAQMEYDADVEVDETTDIIQSSITDKEAFRANIPLSEEAKLASNEKIVAAMFNIGEAYRDDLNDLEKAAREFESLIGRFPSNNLLAESYVALYEIYTKTGDRNKATYYRNLMLQKFPDNSKVLATTDPTYINRLRTAEASEEADYYKALNYYISGKLGDTYRAATNALTKYPSGRLLPQFTLLKILSDNYNGDIIKYKTALEDVVSKYSSNTAAASAKDILSRLEKSEFKLVTETKQETKQDTKPASETKQEAEQTFQSGQEDILTVAKQFVRFNNQVAGTIKSRYSVDDGAHAFVIIADASVNMNRLRFNILSFNTTTFIEENYDVRIADFADNKMIVLSKIKDRNAAMDFFNKISDNKKVFGSLNINDYVAFIILESNLELMRSGTSFLDYVDFFNKVYLE